MSVSEFYIKGIPTPFVNRTGIKPPNCFEKQLPVREGRLELIYQLIRSKVQSKPPRPSQNSCGCNQTGLEQLFGITRNVPLLTPGKEQREKPTHVDKGGGELRVNYDKHYPLVA